MGVPGLRTVRTCGDRGRGTRRTDRNPSVGNRLRSTGKMGWRGGRFDGHYAIDNVESRAVHATAALVMPPPAPPSGHAGSPPGRRRLPGAPRRTIAPLRPSARTARTWGSCWRMLSAVMGCRFRGAGGRRTPSPGAGGAAGYRSPTVGKPVAAPTSRSACGGSHETGVREEASAWATGYAAHAWQSPEHDSRSGGLRWARLVSVPARFPALGAPQGSSLRPRRCFPPPEQRFVPSLVPPSESSARSSRQSRVREPDPQHSQVRTLAIQTTDSFCRRRWAAGNGSAPSVPGSIPATGQQWASCYSHEKPRVSRRRSHRRRSTRWRSLWS